jgi:ATP-dependent Lhr-like helicase
MTDQPGLRRAQGLDARVARSFYGSFRALRPAQAEAIPALLEGRDVIVLAGTGSGKTEAVVAPLVSRLLSELTFATRPVLLYVAPTRALVNDTFRRLEPPFDRLGIGLGVRHGEQNDLNRVKKPATVVTTPESFDVLMWSQAKVLARVRAVVVDEAHLLYNTQRGMQLAILLRRLQQTVSQPLQVVATSATVADGDALWSFFRPGVTPLIVDDPTARVIERQIRLGLTPAQLAERLDRLAMSGTGKVLVFTDSRRECDEVAAILRERTSFAERVFAHHASLSKDVRIHAERSFLTERTAVCVATSTLELGIDIGDIDLVVLWGRALGWQSFLQRIGRGNRRSDTANVLCAVPADRSVRLSAAIGFQALFNQVESGRFEADRPLALFGAACQQVLSIVTAKGPAWRRASDLIELFAPWPHLDAAAVQLILDELVARDVLIKHPVKRWYGPAERAHEIVDQRLIWSNLPLASRDIAVFAGGAEVGRIAGQNLLKLEVGSVFAFGGRRYSVKRLQADRLETAPTTDRATVRLSFGGVGADLDPTLLESESLLLAAGGGGEVSPRSVAEQLESSLSMLHAEQRADTLLCCRVGEAVWHLTFAGRLLNALIAAWLPEGTATAGEVCLVAGAVLDLSRLPNSVDGFGDLLRHVDQGRGRQSIFQTMLPAEHLVQERLDVWRRRPVFGRTLERLRNARVVEVAPPPGLELDGA